MKLLAFVLVSLPALVVNAHAAEDAIYGNWIVLDSGAVLAKNANVESDNYLAIQCEG